MQEFNLSMLEKFKASGFKFLCICDLDHFALIAPVMEECETNESSYFIPIQDEQAWEMATGVNEFSFYVLP